MDIQDKYWEAKKCPGCSLKLTGDLTALLCGHVFHASW